MNEHTRSPNAQSAQGQILPIESGDELAIRKIMAEAEKLKASLNLGRDKAFLTWLSAMLFVVTAARGSVGKSTWAHALIEYLRTLGFTVVVIDADMRRPNLAQAYDGKWRTKTIAFNIGDEGAIGTLGEIIEENIGCPIVLNLGAEADVNLAGTAIVSTINDLLSFTNRKLFVHWLLRREADGPEDLAHFLRQGLNAQAAAVLNLEGTTRARFEHFDAAVARKRIRLDATFELAEMANRVSDGFFKVGVPALNQLADGGIAQRLDGSKWLKTCFQSIEGGLRDAFSTAE